MICNMWFAICKTFAATLLSFENNLKAYFSSKQFVGLTYSPYETKYYGDKF